MIAAAVVFVDHFSYAKSKRCMKYKDESDRSETNEDTSNRSGWAAWP